LLPSSVSLLLNLDTVTAQELAIIIEVLREFKDMDMEGITRDLLILDMEVIML